MILDMRVGKYETRWRHFKQDILERDKHKCQNCGDLGTEVGHIIPIYIGGDEWDTENAQILCESCHKEKTIQDKRKYGGKQSSLFCICGHKSVEHNFNLSSGRKTNGGSCCHEDLNPFSNFGDVRDLLSCSCEKFTYSLIQTTKN